MVVRTILYKELNLLKVSMQFLVYIFTLGAGQKTYLLQSVCLLDRHIAEMLWRKNRPKSEFQYEQTAIWFGFHTSKKLSCIG